MEENQTAESFAETIFRELRKTTPDVSLGFPSKEELQRRRTNLWERERNRRLSRQEEENREFQRLKDAALSRLRKDPP